MNEATVHGLKRVWPEVQATSSEGQAYQREVGSGGGEWKRGSGGGGVEEGEGRC